MRILGIDPGLRRAGWGVIDTGAGGRLRWVASGVVAPPASGALGDRLRALFVELGAVCDEHRPDRVAVEETFVNRDPAGALKLGQARGAAMLAAATRGLPIMEYAPNKVKKTVVGVGHADKAQVAHMVRLLLPGAAPKAHDEADALAVAICCAQHARAPGIAAA